jgi:hypothetical protein
MAPILPVVPGTVGIVPLEIIGCNMAVVLISHRGTTRSGN